MVKLSEDGGRPTDERALVDACAWLLVAAQSAVPAQLQMVVLARIEKLASGIPADRRDQARALATQRLEHQRSQSLVSEGGSAALALPIAQESLR